MGSLGNSLHLDVRVLQETVRSMVLYRLAQHRTCNLYDLHKNKGHYWVEKLLGLTDPAVDPAISCQLQECLNHIKLIQLTRPEWFPGIRENSMRISYMVPRHPRAWRPVARYMMMKGMQLSRCLLYTSPSPRDS